MKNPVLRTILFAGTVFAFSCTRLPVAKVAGSYTGFITDSVDTAYECEAVVIQLDDTHGRVIVDGRDSFPDLAFDNCIFADAANGMTIITGPAINGTFKDEVLKLTYSAQPLPNKFSGLKD